MREIKFRVWNPNANKFVAYSGVKDMPLHEAGALVLNVAVYEVLQYTGLKDRHGVDIYEGDIVRGLEFDEVTETWLPGDEVTDVKWTNSYKPGFYFPQMCEVIGNIYENPGLLKHKTNGGQDA